MARQTSIFPAIDKNIRTERKTPVEKIVKDSTTNHYKMQGKEKKKIEKKIYLKTVKQTVKKIRKKKKI